MICTGTKIELEKLQLELDWNYSGQHLVVQKYNFRLLFIQTLKKNIVYLTHNRCFISIEGKTYQMKMKFPYFIVFSNKDVKI